MSNAIGQALIDAVSENNLHEVVRRLLRSEDPPLKSSSVEDSFDQIGNLNIVGF
jgi:hypothetical protein